MSNKYIYEEFFKNRQNLNTLSNIVKENEYFVPKKSTYITMCIIKLIKDRKLKKGEKLPSESSISDEMGTDRDTVRLSTSILECSGIIEKKAKIGCFMHTDYNSCAFQEFENFIKDSAL